MSKTKFDTKTRAAIWKANNCRCFYCTEPIAFVDLEIDHIIAESTPSTKLEQLTKLLGLNEHFDLNSPRNLVPTHHGCNNRKSGSNLSRKALVFYFELWKKKQGKLMFEYETLTKNAGRDKQLVAIANVVEAGDISKDEIIRYVRQLPTKTRSSANEPVVITFGMNVTEFNANSLPKEIRRVYANICDWLEKDLLYRLLQVLPTLSQQTEESARNGETLSVRIAFWNLDLDRLEEIDIAPWEILGIALFSELYASSADDLLSRSVVRAYQSVVNDPLGYNDGIGRCPRCGSDKLRGFRHVDEERDTIYRGVDCEECGWGDWTEE